MLWNKLTSSGLCSVSFRSFISFERSVFVNIVEFVIMNLNECFLHVSSKTQLEPGNGAGESKQDVSLEAGGSLRLRLGLTRREDEETLQWRGAQKEKF